MSLEQEAELKELCDDYLIATDFERGAVRGSTVTRVYTDLIKKTGSVITSLAHILGQETPQHHAVHVELEDHLRGKKADDAVRAVFDQFMNFQKIVRKARDEHVSGFGGRGRPMRNESLREFIWKLGDLYELAGGRAGVTYEPIDGSLTSPFLAWVIKINGFLPPRIQAKSTTLPDLVRELCRLRWSEALADIRTPEAADALFSYLLEDRKSRSWHSDRNLSQAVASIAESVPALRKRILDAAAGGDQQALNAVSDIVRHIGGEEFMTEVIALPASTLNHLGGAISDALRELSVEDQPVEGVHEGYEGFRARFPSAGCGEGRSIRHLLEVT